MRTTISHEFVDVIPESLDEGVLYVCIQYETAIHRCCCGCGEEVVSPLHPRQWSLVFDGQTISLTPSLGNWSFPCQSHYWIRRNRVHWARPFGRDEIEQLRAGDRRMLEAHFRDASDTSPDPRAVPPNRWTSMLARFRRWL
jgi:Family of unknown function (DUF6527)